MCKTLLLCHSRPLPGGGCRPRPAPRARAVPDTTHFRKDLALLQAFLEQLPPGTRAAFEFRHESWLDEGVHDALRARGAGLCAADVDETGGQGPPLFPTADWGYLRLRRAEYTTADLAAWAERVKALPWSEAYVFFKHEEAGRGAAYALELARLV